MARATSAQVTGVDARLAKMPEPHRTTLRALRATLRKVLPQAQECLKYGMPSFTVCGKGVAAYDAFKQHCSYFPMSGRVLGRLTGIPARYVVTRGTLHFPVDEPLPVALVKKLVKARLDEISDVHDGKRLVFFPDGGLKAEGPMKGGRLHGKWKWYRRDGSLMRTGQLESGEATGVWQTWDRRGRMVKATRY